LSVFSQCLCRVNAVTRVPCASANTKRLHGRHFYRK
jgi:hypothetical protein